MTSSDTGFTLFLPSNPAFTTFKLKDYFNDDTQKLLGKTTQIRY